MLSSHLLLQNAILNKNNAIYSLANYQDNMLNSISSGNSQPLRPNFCADNFLNNELNMKVNETKLTVYQKLIDSIEKSLAKNIKKSIPNYCGIDYKA